MHPNKKMRHTVATLLGDAGLTVSVGGVMQSITVLTNPPPGGWIADTSLPGIYCFVRSERVSAQSQFNDERTTVLDVVLQAKGSSDNAVDQVDDMQLDVERLIAADHTLGGLAVSCDLIGSEVFLNKGEVVFAARRLSFEPVLFAGRLDPSVS